MFLAARQSIARAVLRYNSRRRLYRVLIAFNVNQRNESGKYVFPPQNKCDFVSGDFTEENFAEDLSRILRDASAKLRTDCIEIVG